MSYSSMAADWTPQVTAIVPCYNAETFLQRTLDCLAAQTWPRLEILIGDDASTDNSARIAQEFVVHHDNALLLTRDVNLGWLRNSNDLMAKATGELMFFACHDDVFQPKYVETLVAALRQRPQAILAFSDVEVMDEVDRSTNIRTFDKLSGITSSIGRGFVMVRKPSWWWVAGYGVFRTTAFGRIGGLKANASGEYSADWNWLLHMALLGEFVRVPEVLCQKHHRKASLSKTWPWPPNRAQRRALQRAGIREILGSPLSPPAKIMLLSYFMLRPWSLKRRISARLPLSIKRQVKRLLLARSAA